MTENWIHGWLKSIWKKRKIVPNWSKKDALELLEELDTTYDVKKDDDKKITVFDT